MKIIIFTENGRAGGMDVFISTLIKFWPDINDKFIIICNKNHPGLLYLEKYSADSNTTIIKHSIPINWSFLDNYINFLPKLLQRIIRKILRILLVPYQFIALRKIFKKESPGKLISVNGGYPGGESCRIANIAWKSLGYDKSIHNFHNLASKPPRLLTIYENFIDKWLHKSCKAIVGVSNSCSNSIKVRPVFRNANNILTIYNGLESIDDNKNIKNISLREEFNIPKDDKVVIMLGTYEERKGHQFLMMSMKKVFEKIRNTHLIIFGTGSEDEKTKIMSYIDEHTPDKSIYLPGFISHAAKMIRDANVMLIPSQEHESFGLTAVEAMNNGIPIVSTDIGGLPETIGEDGLCGYCCPKHDYSMFSEKIIYLLDNPLYAKEMGLNGRKRAKKLFNPERMSKEYYSLLSD
jgi:glycosyltransferase involved in cell wall biosynthesis